MLGRKYKLGQPVWIKHSSTIKWVPGVVQAEGTFKVLVQVVDGTWKDDTFSVGCFWVRPFTSKEEQEVTEAIQNLKLLQRKNSDA